MITIRYTTKRIPRAEVLSRSQNALSARSHPFLAPHSRSHPFLAPHSRVCYTRIPSSLRTLALCSLASLPRSALSRLLTRIPSSLAPHSRALLTRIPSLLPPSSSPTLSTPRIYWAARPPSLPPSLSPPPPLPKGPNCDSYTCPDTGRRLTLPRADMQLAEGYYVKTSGDGGRTWSRDTAACVPVRRTRIDRANPWGGENIGFFCCDKPTVVAGSMVYMAFQKTREGGGETPGSEAFFLRSKDFLRVADPAAATWETLPGGDLGLAAADTRLLLGEEPHILQVDNFGRGGGGTGGGNGGDGAAVVEGREVGEAGAGREPRMWCVWRTETGRLANSYSSDGGVSWDKMSWMTFSGKPTGRPFRYV